MRRRAGIVGFALGLWASGGGMASAGSPAPIPAIRCPHAAALPTAATIARARLATGCEINRERRRRRLVPLRGTVWLGRPALAHSLDMVAAGYFAHVAPSGSTPAGRLAAAGYLHPGRWARFGEILAWGEAWRATPASVVRAWMASPAHRAVILSPAFREMGIGIAPAVPAPTPRPVPYAGATYTLDLGVRR